MNIPPELIESALTRQKIWPIGNDVSVPPSILQCSVAAGVMVQMEEISQKKQGTSPLPTHCAMMGKPGSIPTK